MNRIIILFFALLLLLSNSTGFDMYGHSSTYYFYNELHGIYYNFFDLLIIPRYFLLSYVYEFFSRMDILLGYVFIFLALYPLSIIVKSIDNQSINGKIYITEFAILFISYVAVFFYSGLSLALLWGLAYFVSGKKHFLIGMLFHPMGVVLYLLITIFSNKLKIKFIVFTFILFILFVLIDAYVLEIFYCGKQIDNANVHINLRSLDMALLKAKSKLTEVVILFILMASYVIFKNMKINFVIHLKYCIVALVMFSTFIVFYMSGKNTLLNAVFIKNNISNYAIYNTWFDFRDRKYIISYDQMFESRYN